jgi:hypothetical protein
MTVEASCHRALYVFHFGGALLSGGLADVVRFALLPIPNMFHGPSLDVSREEERLLGSVALCERREGM